MTKQQLLLLSLLAFFMFTFVFLPWFGSLVARIVNAIAESRISLYIDYLTLGFVCITLALLLGILYWQLADLDHNSDKTKEFLRIFVDNEQDIESLLVFFRIVNVLPLETRKMVLLVILTIVWMAIVGPAAFAVGSIRSAVEHKRSLAEHQKSLQSLKSQLSQIERKISVHVDERSFDKLKSQLREVEEKVAELSRKLSI